MQVLLLVVLLGFSIAQDIPDGTPRQTGVGFATTDCKNLKLGEEPPFPNNYLDLMNEYFVPSLRKLQSQRDLPGFFRRTFHTPTTGCVYGTFKVRDDLPEEHQVGIFQAGASYPAFVRFSGQDKETQNDTAGDIKGLALKLSNVKGRKLLAGFEDDDHFDIVNNAFPVFQHNNETVFASAIMSRTELCAGNGVCRSQHGQRYVPNAAVGVVEFQNNSVSSQLTMPYYAISPYQFGKRKLPNPAVKYRFWPCDFTPSIGLPLVDKNSTYLTDDMRQRLQQDDYCFRFQIQFQKDPCLHPINDFFVEWLEEDTPFIDFAILHIPKQELLTDTDYTCKHAAFNAWRVPEDHRPLGSLSRARMFAMMNSQNHRLSMNTAIEPFTNKRVPGLQYLTPDECGINDNFIPKFSIKTGLSGNQFEQKGQDTGPVTGYLDRPGKHSSSDDSESGKNPGKRVMNKENIVEEETNNRIANALWMVALGIGFGIIVAAVIIRSRTSNNSEKISLLH